MAVAAEKRSAAGSGAGASSTSLANDRPSSLVPRNLWPSAAPPPPRRPTNSGTVTRRGPRCLRFVVHREQAVAPIYCALRRFPRLFLLHRCFPSENSLPFPRAIFETLRRCSLRAFGFLGAWRFFGDQQSAFAVHIPTAQQSVNTILHRRQRLFCRLNPCSNHHDVTNLISNHAGTVTAGSVSQRRASSFLLSPRRVFVEFNGFCAIGYSAVTSCLRTEFTWSLIRSLRISVYTSDATGRRVCTCPRV